MTGLRKPNGRASAVGSRRAVGSKGEALSTDGVSATCEPIQKHRAPIVIFAASIFSVHPSGVGVFCPNRS